MPPSQQLPGVELPTQQPHVYELPTQQGTALLFTSADDDSNDAPPTMVVFYVSLPSMFDAQVWMTRLYHVLLVFCLGIPIATQMNIPFA